MFSLTLALALMGAQTAAPTQAQAGWAFKESADPAKPKSATATVRAADGSRLLLRCDTAKMPIVSVQFLPKPPLTPDPTVESPSATVTLTLDNAKADITSWLLAGSGAYDAEAAEVFLIAQEIAAAKTVRVSLSQGEEVIARDFVGPGGDATFRQVYAACGLPYALPTAATPAQ